MAEKMIDLMNDLQEMFRIREDQIIINDDTIEMHRRRSKVILPNPREDKRPERIQVIANGDQCYLEMEKEMVPSDWNRNPLGPSDWKQKLLDLIRLYELDLDFRPKERNHTEDFSDWCKSANIYFRLHPEDATRPIIITLGKERSSHLTRKHYHYVDGMLRLAPKSISFAINSPKLVKLDEDSANSSVNQYPFDPARMRSLTLNNLYNRNTIGFRSIRFIFARQKID